MPGLLRAVGRTAVVAGTATAVSNRVSRRQANRWSQQYEEQQPAQYAPPPQQYAPPPQQYAQPAPVAAAAPDPIEQLKGLAQLRDQGVLTEEEFTAQKAKILGS
jgi:Short C-terminal domain